MKWRGATVLALAVGAVAPPAVSAAPPPDCHRGAPPIIRDGFPQPPMRYSRGGVLNTPLRASVGPVQINGESVIASTYEGLYPGPMLMTCAGDRLTVRFKNDLPEPTNLHTHGFHIDPRANHDNVFLELPPGKAFTYDYRIPLNNSAGAYWYHPHLHGRVYAQTFAGLAGGIVQEGGLDRLPSLRKVPQRFMVLTTTYVKDGRVQPVEDSPNSKTPIYVNGALNPTVKIRPGQIQRWRIFNASNNRMIVLRLAGQRFRVLAHDADTLARMRTVTDLSLPPGSRREILVRGGAPGSYTMRALPFAQLPGQNTVAGGGPTPNQSVVTLNSGGRRTSGRLPRKPLHHRIDLRRQRIDRRRTITFDRVGAAPGQPGPVAFPLNGHTFDPNRVLTMKLGSLEEWTLVNRNPEWHTFHIHVNEFQVISINGKPRRFIDYEDNVQLPPMARVVIRMRPEDFTGKFVFHCHITFHEDHGMMAAIQVLRNPTAEQLRPAVAHHGPLMISSAAYHSPQPPTPGSASPFLCRPLALRRET